MGFIITLFIIFVGGGWLIGKTVGYILFPDDDKYNDRQESYIDNSVHNHFHVHTSTKNKEIEELGKYADNLQN